MFAHKAVPYLQGLTHEKIFSHEIRIFGMGESQVEAALHEVMSVLCDKMGFTPTTITRS